MSPVQLYVLLEQWLTPLRAIGRSQIIKPPLQRSGSLQFPGSSCFVLDSGGVKTNGSISAHLLNLLPVRLALQAAAFNGLHKHDFVP